MKIVDNLLVLPVYIQPAFKSISTVSHNNPIWQTIPSIHYSVSKIKLAQVIFKTSFENPQIITPGCLDARCFQSWYHIWIVFPSLSLESYVIIDPRHGRLSTCSIWAPPRDVIKELRLAAAHAACAARCCHHFDDISATCEYFPR